jgi:hypothetical protein
MVCNGAFVPFTLETELNDLKTPAIFIALSDGKCTTCQKELEEIGELADSSSFCNTTFLHSHFRDQEEVARKLNCSGLICFKLIKDDLVYTYTGPRSKEYISSFLLAPSGPTAPIPPLLRTVKELDDSNFNEFLSSGDWFLFVYVPWSGTCRRTAPYVNALARRSDLQDIRIAKISLLTEIEFLHQFSIDRINEHFPILLRFHNGKYLKYEGPLEESDMATYLRHSATHIYTQPLPPRLGFISHLIYDAEDYFHGPAPFLVCFFLIIEAVYLYFIFKYCVFKESIQGQHIRTPESKKV